MTLARVRSYSWIDTPAAAAAASDDEVALLGDDKLAMQAFKVSRSGLTKMTRRDRSAMLRRAVSTAVTVLRHCTGYTSLCVAILWVRVEYLEPKPFPRIEIGVGDGRLQSVSS